MKSKQLDLDLDRFLAPFEARRLAFYRFDVVVVGSGVAGSTAALAAAEEGASVALVVKDELEETNTRYAQGGVAVVLDPSDSFEAHVADTLNVGLGLSDPVVVGAIVRGGPAAIEHLAALGASFDRTKDGKLHLSREGGHTQPRIVHSQGAATGIEIQRTLSRSVRQAKDVALFERTFAIDLLSASDGRVIGVLCQTARGELVAFSAGQVILATGGSGQIYRETTNPSIATGDGVAMAFRAGAALRDLEFFQFHPTCLYIAGAARVLVSEIVRGAGGILLDRDGVRFMPEYHPSAELAPRDVVSRACFHRMVATGDTNVYLDLSDLEQDPHELFPGISRICHEFSIDIARDPIPVRPGAHYMIGGVLTDAGGRTTVPGLWAVGECASSGLHGANRMGSNSLLEGMVVGREAGVLAACEARETPLIPLERDLRYERREPSHDVRVSIQDMTYSLKSLMWRQLGIVRRGQSIGDAIGRIGFWTRAVLRLAAPEPRAWELINMLTLSRLMAQAADFREESRGTHYREDYSATSPEWLAHTLLAPRRQARGTLGLALTREPVAGVAAAR
jgi:L-aspartate oxidase